MHLAPFSNPPGRNGRSPPSDFHSAGVEVTAVRKLHLGIGRRDATAPSGAGLLYIDDIWITGPPPAAE
jgi:hypothetical protein